MSGVTSPTLPLFSYAQAARGMSLPSTTSQTAAEPQPPKEDTVPDPQKTSGSEPPNLQLATQPAESRDLNDEKSTPEGHLATQVQPEETREADGNLHESSMKQPDSPRRGPSSTRASTPPSSGAASIQPPNLDEASSTLKGSSDSTWDEQSQSSSSLEKSAATLDNDNDIDQDRAEKGKKKNSNIEPELKAAPIPTINVWQERRKAQEAKAQASSTLKTQTPSVTKTAMAQNTASNLNPKPDPAKNGTALRSEENDSIIGKDKKSGSEGPKNREEMRKGLAKGVRHTGDTKAFTESSRPPPVADATMWPTPENALFEDKRKVLPFEKAEKPEIKSPASKTHGRNKWEHVPHVPTVKFNTPLPPVATRRGGKGPPRGGREGTARGGHTPSSSIGGDKPVVIGPAPTSRQEFHRGRPETQAENARNSSYTGPTRRATSVDTATAEHRKAAPISQVDRPRPENKKYAESKPIDPAVVDTSVPSSKPRQNSKPFTKGSSGLTTPSHKTSPVNHGGPHSFSGDAQTYPRYPAERRSTAHDLFKDTGLGIDRSDPQGRESIRRREFNGERHELGREKSDSWRDRDPYNDRTERRDSRSERGGRGGYRARGNHSGFNNHGYQSHAFTAPLPQQPFPTPKSNTHNNDRSRQTSVPYVAPTPTQSNNRSTPRANTLGSTQMYTAPNTMPNVPQQLAPIMTEFAAMYPYPNMPMTAQPYSQFTDSYAILQMVSTQLEYYFSVDNLCKDIFLRRHMDSQGYVLLSVIAGFKRIKTLTDDMSLIRYACQSLNSVDYMPDEEGKEKIRARGHWNQWVLPKDQRDASAKNDGPIDSNGFSNLHQVDGTAGEHSTPLNGLMNGATAEVTQFVPRGPGYDFQMVETPISAALDDPKPGQPGILTGAPIPAGITTGAENGVGEGAVDQTQTQNGPGSVFASPDPEENSFTNQQTENLTVVCRERNGETSQIRPPFVSVGSRTFSNGSLDNHALAERSQISTPVPTLRGGAADFHHLERDVHSRTISPSNSLDRFQDHSPVFWLKDGAPAVDLHQNGLTHMPYNTLRSNAFAQRQTLAQRSPDMEILYQFWSHFLVRNFNTDMYNEFRELVLEDSNKGLTNGLNHLLRYYEAVLSNSRVLPDRVAADLVKLAELERDESRPAFTRLRAAWRNGAFSLKSRKKIDNLISPELKAQLEA